MKLPKQVVLKSTYNNKYLRCRDGAGEQQGFLQFSGDDAASLDSRFEVVNSSSGLIHLKCCSNNKHWARSSSKKWWIKCGAGKPVKDQSDSSCTLFQPFPVEGIDGGLRLLHVQLNHYACAFNSGPPFGDCLYAGSQDPNLEDFRDVFIVLNASKKLPTKHSATTITALPRFVALKSRYNHKYVRYRHGQGEKQEGFLDVSEEDPMSRYAKFEVVKAKSAYNDDDDNDKDDDEEEEEEEGLVHLKCCYNNKYWKSSSEGQWWISGSAKKPKEDRSHWSCTLFKPVYVRDGDPTSLRFLHVQLKRYACLFRSDSPYGDCLYAASEAPSPDLADVFTFVDWETLSPPPKDESGSDDDRPKPPKRPSKEKWRPREEKPRRHRRREDGDKGQGYRETASDGEEENPTTEAEKIAEEKDEYGAYGSDGEVKTNPKRRTWPPEDDGAEKSKGIITAKADSYALPTYTVVASANDFWGAIFASTAILPQADRDYYSSIKQVKGNGFTERSIRRIDFGSGRVPQWKDWREQILVVNHKKKELKLSVVNGGPLNQCGSFKTSLVVEPRFENAPKSHGCEVKWRCEYADAERFNLKEMKKLVLRTFRRLDDYLYVMAARESSSF